MDVTAITRRKNAVMTSWVSQVTPSESSCIKRPAYEAAQMLHLKNNLGIQGVVKVITHEPLTSLHKLIVIQFEKNTKRTEIWRALYGVASFRRAEGKWVVAVDKDIDADNSDAIFWAMSYRCKPHRDVKMLEHKDEGHGPRSLIDSEDSAVLIDATLKETFPPISLPKREYMENARKHLGRARPAEAAPGDAVVRLRSRRMERASRAPGAARGEERILADRRMVPPAPPQRCRDEHRNAHAGRRPRLRGRPAQAAEGIGHPSRAGCFFPSPSSGRAEWGSCFLRTVRARRPHPTSLSLGHPPEVGEGFQSRKIADFSDRMTRKIKEFGAVFRLTSGLT